jgi:D-alanyl-lipoteichoic acid acyltransferase DltB (MBOAT superfamily)
MLFNSLDFAIFLPIVFFTYWFVTANNLKLQNFLVLIASYVFYGWWDWRFLSLIIFSTIVDYSIGRRLGEEDDKKKRKYLLWSSIGINLGFLGFFKYYNFFLENFIDAFTLFGYSLQANSLNIILPVGISFYTFQTMSYTIDIYRRKLEPTRDIMAFGAFVSFFPQLVAGPIERANNLLPQFYKKRDFHYELGVSGVQQILWGLFKKMVIADNCAEYANLIFNNYQDYNGATLLLGSIFFTFQIYGDFSGYSDIAIGTSKLFGFKLMRNFATPYLSRDIAEFWRRWHISLSTWFRDYLYIPLGGSRGSTITQVRNVFIIFIVSGFWHGSNWTFIAWGALNALYFLPLLLLKKNRTNVSNVVAEGKTFPTIKELLQISSTFTLTAFAWIFFRADNLNHACGFIAGIFTKGILMRPSFVGIESGFFVLIMILIFIVIEFVNRNKSIPLSHSKFKGNFLYDISSIVIMSLSIYFLYNDTPVEFIYFQF